MAADGLITLALEGEPSLDDLATALGGLRALLAALTRSAAPNGSITWTVETLQDSSALATFRGVAEEPELPERIADDYLHVAQALARRDFHAQRRGSCRSLDSRHYQRPRSLRTI